MTRNMFERSHYRCITQITNSSRAITDFLAIRLGLKKTRNSSGDEIANVNFLYDDIVQALENTIDSCINSATDRFLQRRFTKI